MQTAIYNKEEKPQNIAQIVVLSLGTHCPPRDPSLLVSCSPVPHHVIPEGPLEEHRRNFWRNISRKDGTTSFTTFAKSSTWTPYFCFKIALATKCKIFLLLILLCILNHSISKKGICHLHTVICSQSIHLITSFLASYNRHGCNENYQTI